MGLKHCGEEIEHAFNKKHGRKSPNLREKMHNQIQVDCRDNK